MSAVKRKARNAWVDMQAMFWMLFGIGFLFGLLFMSVYVVRLAWRLGGGG